ncbi:hypothetical protein C8R44DRAFT_641767 [Mycena epipterygia]|nr:hypothetical protein C8R44DRAFT_641767 [Mycena epipterygia]
MPTWTSRTQIDRVATVLAQEAVTASDFVITLLERPSYSDHPCTTSLVDHAAEIIDVFAKHPGSGASTFAWARKAIQKKTVDSITLLTANEDWHFGAVHASATKLEDFQIEEMAATMKLMAPDLWNLLHLLLSKDHQDMKIVVMISIMMQSRNNKCNALESVFGIFLHSTNTPEKVIQALAHMGISISPTAILSAIHALSTETIDTLREMGQTLLVGYAYDNFDINFPTIVPVIEKTGDPLTHLTSGVVICLEHDVTLEDLECSEELWAKSVLNPLLDESPSQEARHLEAIHPETVEQIPLVKMRYAPARAMDINQSTHAGNISAVENLLGQGGVGPPLPLEDPKEKDPVRIAQRKRMRKLVSILKYVVLFFGDLGTFERVQGVLLRRSIESTPWLRHQFMVFVMGFFHLKMACADAIWRIFIEPKTGRADPNSLMAYVAQHRPRETGKIGSNPGFRRMHEVIRHDGIVLRLDAWRVEAKRRNPLWTSLEEFAKSKPSDALLDDIANHLAEHYVSGGEVDIYQVRSRPVTHRDKQNENIMIMHQYFLLYEETSFSMNRGDIGRLETTFIPWISIFRAVGKHKYSAHMKKYLTDVHFVYPPRLGRAVRYNSLVCPTGIVDQFRGVDWVEESMINLYTKHTFGGSGSNYTKARVIEESTLIKIYHSCHRTIEQNFCLTSLTRRHAAPDMTKTFAHMAEYVETNSPNEHKTGRDSAYSIPDMLDRGDHLMYNIAGKPGSIEDDGIDQAIEEEDLAVEYS